ncbi:MAG: GNAT family N-acetyltransferase [Granulosicoccus sp.]|nr:GNAT family N-acetyltransferase [Granulosicoccus sp.]
MDIRQAIPSDAENILSIYRSIVEDTTISFETCPPTAEEISRRIVSILSSHEWLVAHDNDGITGYAYASKYRPRQAYRYAVETTIYVHQRCRGQGLGKRLYSTLFSSLDSLGFHSMYAGIALPNPASIALHEAVGFEPIGVFKDAGFKFEQWHDVSWWQRPVSLTD